MVIFRLSLIIIVLLFSAYHYKVRVDFKNQHFRFEFELH